MQAVAANAERNTTEATTSDELILPICCSWKKASAATPARHPPIKRYRMPFIEFARRPPDHRIGAMHDNRGDRRASRSFSDFPRTHLVATSLLGAPGRSRAAHIVQFRAVGVERHGYKLPPEGAEFCQRFCQSGACMSRGVKGCRADRSHDAGLVFRTPVSALKTIFRPIY
jgi:hypothetical protein